MWRTNQISLLQEIPLFLRLLLPLEVSTITNEYQLPEENSNRPNYILVSKRVIQIHLDNFQCYANSNRHYDDSCWRIYQLNTTPEKFFLNISNMIEDYEQQKYEDI